MVPRPLGARLAFPKLRKDLLSVLSNARGAPGLGILARREAHGGAAFRDTCLIIDWPDGIREGGSLRRYRGQLPDIMATVLEITGAKYRGIYDPNEIAPL
jgi:hypothetical protein